MNELQQDTSGFNVVFVHSALDDAGLTPQEFRVYAHLARRSMTRAWPAIESIAAVCRIHKDTVKFCLKNLLERRLIARTSRPGKTSLYSLTPASDWIDNATKPNGVQTPPPPRFGGLGSNDHPPGLEGHHPPGLEGHHPPGLEGHEGNPRKRSTEGNPSRAPRSLPAFPEGFPESHKAPLLQWLAYKQERRQTYRPTAWLLLCRKAAPLPASTLSAAVEQSITSNWSGLFFDRIANKPTASQPHDPFWKKNEAAEQGSLFRERRASPAHTSPPAGWEAAADDLFDFDWRAVWPSWDAVPSATRRDIQSHLRLDKKQSTAAA